MPATTFDPRVPPAKRVAMDYFNKRDAEEEARQQRLNADARAQDAAKRATEIAPYQLTQEQEAAKKAQEATLQRTVESDFGKSVQDPDLAGKQYNELPIDYRKLHGEAYGPVAGNLARTWNSAQAQTTGLIPGLQLQGATIGPDGGMLQHHAAPTTSESTGQVTERDLAEAGLDPASIPRNQWATALSAKREPVKAKLDVQQKAALGSAAQAVPVMMTAMKDYDAISRQAGPVMGRVSGMKESMGMGTTEFASANSKLQGNLFNVARALQGAGVLTEKDIVRMEQIAPALTMGRDQFQGKVNAVKELMRERLTAWRDLNMNALDESQRALVDRLIEQTATEAPAGQPASPAPTQPSGSSPTPAIKYTPGLIRNGYRFKGGNPTDQNSWEPVQ